MDLIVWAVFAVLWAVYWTAVALYWVLYYTVLAIYTVVAGASKFLYRQIRKHA